MGYTRNKYSRSFLDDEEVETGQLVCEGRAVQERILRYFSTGLIYDNDCLKDVPLANLVKFVWITAWFSHGPQDLQ